MAKAKKSENKVLSDSRRLDCSQLRWRCDASQFKFETTDEIKIASQVVGQDTAQDALRFGIECLAFGQNVYVRGPRGTGRITMVRQLLKQLQPQSSEKRDRCYVHNFAKPDRPRLVTLAAGTAPEFQKRLAELADFIREGLRKSLDAEPFLSQRERAREELQSKIRDMTNPLEEELAQNGMTLVSVQQGPMSTTIIAPVVDGEPVPPEQLKTLIAQGKVAANVLAEYEQRLPKYQKELDRVSREVGTIFRLGRREIEQLKQNATRSLMSTLTTQLIQDFPGSGVTEFIEEIIRDVAENRLGNGDEEEFSTELYGVNILVTHRDPLTCPIIEEVVPNIINLLGTVDSTWDPKEGATSDYRGIRGGAILNADGGYLILDVEDLISEPGAYRALMRTLRTRRLEIVPPEMGWMRPYAVIQPEPIEVKVRVILIGDVNMYYMLDYQDPDFRELFKVLADFEDQIPRDQIGIEQYAMVIAQLAREEKLPAFHRTAVAALTEHGARIIARDQKLTARFGRVADIAREAAFIAQQAKSTVVTGDHVCEVVRRTKQRAGLPSKNFRELIESKIIRLETQGDQIGQINGLAVIQAGPLTYGFPARITATIGPGSAGLIDIEGHARMGGSIHTKGFQIIGGLLRYLLHTDHPLSFNASIAFEQSYGMIDGDSASAAETVCLLSALTSIPVKQNLAITGAIDQLGNIQAIGGVNEKIEGFFDVCSYFGLTGDQGVLIPISNVGDLMLREDVVKACSEGKFHIYGLATIHDALELLLGTTSTGIMEDGKYATESVLGLAVAKAHDYWKKTMSNPLRKMES